MDWATFTKLRACETTMCAAVQCGCGARAWRLTNPTSLRSLVARLLGIKRLDQIAFRCSRCGALIHVSQREYLAIKATSIPAA